MIAHYHTDPRIHDRPRIMRLPGSIHVKQPPNGDAMPRLVTIEGQERWHAFSDLMAGLPDVQVTNSAPRSAPEGAKLDTTEAIERARSYLRQFEQTGAPWGENDPADTYALAARLKDFGVAEETCVDLLMGPLPQGERAWIRTTVSNAFKYGKNEPGCDLANSRDAPYLSEQWLAQTFVVEHFNDMRYTALWNQWHLWNGVRWQRDDKLRAFSIAQDLCRREAKRLSEGDGRNSTPRVAKTLAKAQTRAAVISLARENQALAMHPDDWDVDPWLLGTPGS